MDQDILKLVNSKNPADRKKVLSEFLATPNWHKNMPLIDIFLNDSEQMIRRDIGAEVVKQPPAMFMNQLRQMAEGDDEFLRVESLKGLTQTRSHKNVDIFLNRIPFEEEALATAMTNVIAEMLSEDQNKVLDAIFAALSSAEDEVRKIALALFVKAPEKASAMNDFLAYIQSISPSLRSRIFELAKEKIVLFATLSVQVLKEESEPNVRMQALAMLNYFEDKALEDLLIAEMEHKDWALKRTAMLMLGELKSEKAKPLLIEKLSDPNDSIDAIAALDKYKQADIGVAYIKKIGKASDKEQMVLLNAIENIAGNDSRYVEPLLVFAGHTVSKEKAKIRALEVVEKICKTSSTEIPAQVAEIRKQIHDAKIAELPDLGLKIARD